MTVRTADCPGVSIFMTMPEQALVLTVFAGVLQTLKLWASLRSLLTLNTTVPSGAWNFESVNISSEGLPAITEIVVLREPAAPPAAGAPGVISIAARTPAAPRTGSQLPDRALERLTNPTSL